MYGLLVACWTGQEWVNRDYFKNTVLVQLIEKVERDKIIKKVQMKFSSILYTNPTPTTPVPTPQIDNYSIEWKQDCLITRDGSFAPMSLHLVCKN